MRIPNNATAREPINRPDTYQRLPLSKHNLTCDQQPIQTYIGAVFTTEGTVKECGGKLFNPVVDRRL